MPPGTGQLRIFREQCVCRRVSIAEWRFYLFSGGLGPYGQKCIPRKQCLLGIRWGYSRISGIFFNFSKGSSEKLACDDRLFDLFRPFIDLDDLGVTVESLDVVLGDVAVSAMELE